MDALLLQTKLYRPAPRLGLTPRPRLAGRLDDALRPGCRLVLVAAPAGYGKTTLISSWLDHLEAGRATACAWLSLDEADNDPARFLAYLVAALQSLDPGLGSELASLLSMPQLPPLEALFTRLINELLTLPAGPGGQPALIVLDDFHLLRDTALLDGLEFFLERLPPHFRLVLTTREDPPLPLARLRVRGELVELRAADLRFTREEAALFFEQALGVTLLPELLDALEARTEGWIAGLQLAAMALRETGPEPEAARDFLEAFSGSHRYVIDYLVEEVLRRQPEAVQTFLLRTAVLDRFNAELCEYMVQDEAPAAAGGPALTGSFRQPVAALINQLERANLFLVPLDAARKWYRYHHLFAGVLRAGLEAEEEARLHRRAAAWWEARREAEEAIRHSLAARDYPTAGRLIAGHAMQAIRQGGVRTLSAWIAALPQTVLQSDPDLPAFQAVTLLLTGNVAAAREWIERLRAAGAAGEAGSGDAARLRAGRERALSAWLAMLMGHPGGLPVARQAVELLGDRDPFFRVMALIPLGTLLHGRGDLAGSSAAFREAYEIGLREGHLFAAMGGLSNLLFNLIELGRGREARALCEAAFEQHVDQRGRPLPVLGIIYVPYAVLMLEEYDLPAARQYAGRARELCQELFSSVMMGGDSEMVLAQVALAEGDPGQAFALIEETRRAAQKRSITSLVLRLDFLEANLRMRAGDVQAAARLLEPYRADRRGLIGLPASDSLAGLSPAMALHFQHALARLLLEQGQHAEAREILRSLEQEARDSARGMALVSILVLRALVEQAAGCTQAVRTAFREALSLAAPNNMRRYFLREGPALRALLLDSRSTAPQFVDALLAALGPAGGEATASQPAIKRAPGQELVEPLSEQEMKIMRLLAEGKSNQEIAERLYISVGTTKWHVHNILGKLSVSSRTQAIARAREFGLV